MFYLNLATAAAFATAAYFAIKQGISSNASKAAGAVGVVLSLAIIAAKYL